MADPVFFTVEGDYRAVTGDVTEDLDAEPQISSVSATVTFTPSTQVGDVILAVTATPRPTGYLLSPIVGRIDTDGRVKRRVDPDGPVHTYASVAAFPGTGVVGHVYIATDTDLSYRWTGSGYVEAVNFTPVRLLADTPLLGLGNPLFYSVKFTNVRFNAAEGVINPFTFQAPSSDISVNLITVGRAPGQPAYGAERGPAGAPVDDAQLVGGDIQFYVQGTPIGDLIPVSGAGVGSIDGGTP